MQICTPTDTPIGSGIQGEHRIPPRTELLFIVCAANNSSIDDIVSSLELSPLSQWGYK